VRVRQPRLLKIASACTLLSLGLMVWAFLHPVPLAVMAAMSIGQAIGTCGAAAFGLVVYRDLRSLQKQRAAARRSSAPPPEPSPPPESGPPGSAAV
jgi:hypothetical protein